MSRWTFKATMLKMDKRSGLKKGRVLRPMGFYYNGRFVILIGGMVPGFSTTRLALFAEDVKIEVTKESK